MGIIKNFSTFSFYYILPTSLGFITGLAIKDSQILGNKRKIAMSVFSYYSNLEETIPNQIMKLLPDLEYLKNVNKTRKENNTNDTN
jgi:hypothetical protein